MMTLAGPRWGLTSLTLLALACSDDAPDVPQGGLGVPQRGSIRFELSFSALVEVASVNATCTRSKGGPELTNSLEVTTSTISGRTVTAATWTGLSGPADYDCRLEAASTDMRIRCSASLEDIRVEVDRVTTVDVPLQCIDTVPRGGINIAASVNVCPGIWSIGVAPLGPTVGNETTLTASVANVDSGSVRLRWTVSPSNVGTIADSSANPIRLMCDLAGTATVTVVAGDDEGCELPAVGAAIARVARAVKTAWVACLPVGRCGNGGIELGEECDLGDEGNADTTAYCTANDDRRGPCRVKLCGDGVVDPITEAQLDPVARPDTLFEECDDGNRLGGDGCSAGCRIER